MARKVLFLDVDDVLNRYPEQRGQLDPELRDRYLNWIKDKPIDVILCSDWRRNPGAKDTLRAEGITWVGQTIVSVEMRGTQVERYVLENNIKEYAILDDGSDFHYWQKPRHVQPMDGLQDHHLEQLDKILKLGVR